MFVWDGNHVYSNDKLMWKHDIAPYSTKSCDKNVFKGESYQFEYFKVYTMPNYYLYK